MRSLLFTLLLLPSLASAVPAQLTHTGRLLDNGGAPVTGQQSVTVSLYTSAIGGSPVWTDTFNTAFEEGYYAITLGSGAALNASVLDNSSLYVGITLAGGDELSPRLAINSVPYALRAGSVAGGAVDATSVTVNGQTVISSAGTIDYSRITGAPSDADTLSNLSCSDGQVAAWNGSAWACANASSGGGGDIDASAIISGTVAYQRLPVGSSANTVAAGDHTHSFSNITGQAAFSQLPVGTTADTVAAGNHTHTLGAMLGTIGTSAAWPAVSCLEIKQRNPSATDGVYWLNPEGDGRSAFSAYCDMTTDGGGWTMCYTQNGSAMVRLQTQFEAAPAFGTSGYRSDCRNLPFKDVLYVNHGNNEKAWFKRDIRNDITMAANYNAAGNVYGLWTAGGVAETSYKYQLNVCDTSWMWVGLMMSGRSTACDKACGSWCSDTITQYYRTDGDDGGSYNGVSFRENGHRNVGDKTMSVGIR